MRNDNQVRPHVTFFYENIISTLYLEILYWRLITRTISERQKKNKILFSQAFIDNQPNKIAAISVNESATKKSKFGSEFQTKLKMFVNYVRKVMIITHHEHYFFYQGERKKERQRFCKNNNKVNILVYITVQMTWTVLF